MKILFICYGRDPRLTVTPINRAWSDDDIRALAARINDSDALMRVYAAPEWDCLNDDGKLWVCALVRETLRTAGGVS